MAQTVDGGINWVFFWVGAVIAFSMANVLIGEEITSLVRKDNGA
jgi:hypothetical protein